MKIDAAPMSLNPSSAGPNSAADLRKAAEGFESIFLNTFMKAAREASLGDDIMGGGGVDAARDMYDTQMAEILSTRSRLGIAEAVQRQFASFVAKSE